MRRSKKKNKTNLLVFILSIVVILSSVIAIKYYYNNVDDKDDDKDDDKVIEEKDDNKNKEDIKKDPEKDDESKYYKNIDYFKSENLNRYLAYKEKNNNLTYEQIVTFVNIGLDYGFYNYINNADMSKNTLVLMNKFKKLASDYEPDDLETINDEYFINGNTLVRKLRKEAKEAFEMMSQASIDNGTPVYGQSGYRPYSMQESLYNNAVKSLGRSAADNDTARPGHSEHQTGLAIDVSSTKSGNMLSFANTSSFTWMQTNAYKYGFILRYDKTTTDITGFMYESWHYRYVGVKVATDMHDNYSYLTYDEYYTRFIDK